MTTRRELLIAFGAGTVIAPLSSFAQQRGKVWRVGYLSVGSRPTVIDSGPTGAFMQGMRALGYVEGNNLQMEWRFAGSHDEQLPGLAAEMVQLKVDVIVAGNSQAIRAAQKATDTIPIVMGSTGDAVGSGFIKSLAHPGGNITGLTTMSTDVSGKLIEMLRDMVPKLSYAAVLVDPTSASYRIKLKNIQTAATTVGMKLLPVEARSGQEIERGFSLLIREKVGAVVVTAGSLFAQQARQISALAIQSRLPSIAGTVEYAAVGGLIGYGATTVETSRRAATYVDKIFKGTKPSDLPVGQPMIFELVINGKTAKLLGLKIPQSLLIMANKVIE